MSNQPEPRPNMQQIGHAAGVSKSAVSLALRNDPRIPETTRLRIQKIAREMGYRRNPVVDLLMTQLRAGRRPNFQANLGLINCSPRKELAQAENVSRLLDGVRSRADELGYGVEEFWLGQSEMCPQLLRQTLETRGIHGLLLIADTYFDSINAGYLDVCFECASVVIGGTKLDAQLNCSSSDQYLSTRRATEKALELGYKRPVLVLPPEEDLLSEDKYSSGFYSATRRLEAANQIDVIALNVDAPGAALLAIRQQKPDVVISSASKLYLALQADGVSIPKDMGFIHLDWSAAVPNLAGMRRNNRQVGAAGVDLVVEQLRKNALGAQDCPKLVQVESTWVDGPSVRGSQPRQAAS